MVGSEGTSAARMNLRPALGADVREFPLGTIGCFLKAHSGDYGGLASGAVGSAPIRTAPLWASWAPFLLMTFEQPAPAWRRLDDGEWACRRRLHPRTLPGAAETNPASSPTRLLPKATEMRLHGERALLIPG